MSRRANPNAALARAVWSERYRCASAHPPDANPSATWARVAACAAAEGPDPRGWRGRYHRLMASGLFLPAGRVLAGADCGDTRTLLNCFVMSPAPNGQAARRSWLAEAAVTLAAGGGVGWDFSALRGGSGAVLDTLTACERMCRAATAGESRGGAMMAALDMAHADAGDFIRAKRQAGVLPRFNLSLLVDDACMLAVAGQREPGSAWRVGEARSRWRQVLESMLASSEPGLLFTDTINRENNLWWRERLAGTNPCGEAPLPAYGACMLGSINLARLVLRPFTPRAHLDVERLEVVVSTAVRMLDDLLDRAGYPLARQRRVALQSRRLGLGVMGLADALAMLGQRYDTPEAAETAGRIMERVKLAAYAASVRLARRRGPFLTWRRDPFLTGAFVSRLPGKLRDAIARDGLRNSHLLAVAPTGSISLLAGNVSPGIEPIPLLEGARSLQMRSDTQGFPVVDPAWSAWRRRHRGRGPFMQAGEVSPLAQLAIQAAVQRQVDGAIAKTLLVPADTTIGQLDGWLRWAHRHGIKGLAVHRPGSVRACPA
ncbi:MAG: ribonucleoside-diphosphate reductase, adenosylcobalamin-dependent [Steroidobacteraceae bacterium]